MVTGQVNRGRTALFLVAGIAIGIICLFFAIANDTWIPVSIPTWPWRTEPYWVAFEARVWVVMLFAFALGAVVVFLACLGVGRSRKTVDPTADDRVRRLERELVRVTRLLTLTQNKR